mmetsp:Transcript_18668/g.18910  ORF Transcript_18668/g.18910 Transcript_18668/m.18910 type:complete len:81 (-) Transcript_18668:33-275(-)
MQNLDSCEENPREKFYNGLNRRNNEKHVFFQYEAITPNNRYSDDSNICYNSHTKVRSQQRRCSAMSKAELIREMKKERYS